MADPQHETRDAGTYDETARAGLRAAAGTWACTCHSSDPCQHCLGFAATAVAAFLRAFDPSDRISPHLLASMVEEAARAR